MQQESFIIKHSKAIISTSLIGIVFCIILTSIIVVHKELTKPTYLSIQFAPSTATLTLDVTNQEYHTGSYEFKPGSYTGTLSAPDFLPKTISFEVKAHQANSLSEYLLHSTEKLQYFEKSAANIYILRFIKNDTSIDDFLKEYDRKTSIYEKLPFNHSWYENASVRAISSLTITDGRKHPKCNSTLCLLFSSSTENYAEFSKAIAENAYNINDYEVIYEKTY